MARIVELDGLESICSEARKEGKIIVTTNGCFDILHVGHSRLLQYASEQGDLLIVGVNSDDSVRRLKGSGRPINSASDRAELLAALSSVDLVCIFEEDTPDRLLQLVKPDIHVKGGDYRIENLPESRLIESLGGKIVLAQLIPGKSTTALVSRIHESDSSR